jgi:hypothetical protein
MILLQIQKDEPIWADPGFLQLIALILMLLVLVYLVFRVSKYLIQMPSPQMQDQNITEKRLELYDRIATRLYDVFSFFSYTGNWMELSPREIIRVKRELDKELGIYGPLFTSELVEKCESFIKLCFISASGWEHELKIKSLYELRQEHQPGWDDEWIRYFDQKNVADAVMLKEKFNELINDFKLQLSHTQV